MKYKKPNVICYRLAQLVSWIVATFVFGRKYIRNEIRGKKGAFVVIANHEAALDFVNLIGATTRPMSFVISKSFFSTLPIQGFLMKMGVIPKQQFQTSSDDLKKMKRVIDAGQPVVIYPAGLMCEDGLSTPIPGATYKFLRWLNADVYVARTRGSYFVMPKWSKKLRPGRTTMDIYQLFTKEELKNLTLEQIQEKTDSALLYDAYLEQEEMKVKYRGNRDLRGLENVLYQCPNCHNEFSVSATEQGEISCNCCGFRQVADEYGFFRKVDGPGEEVRYVSQWSRWIYDGLARKLEAGEEMTLSARTKICMVDDRRHKFIPVGEGILTLDPGGFRLEGTLGGAALDKGISIAGLPTLPFSPGKHLELQDGGTIYRCVLDDGRLVMKFIHMLKIFYELSQKEKTANVKCM
jgi:DNA-directed RNA polymerase subunit RPC12/RpoP